MESLVLETIENQTMPYPSDESRRALLGKMSQAKYVLLGEASHGTAEYYKDRAEWSKRLISEHGFRFIAVEGDWSACYALNRYVKGREDAGEDVREALSEFARWPSWMWANEDILELAEWLRAYNKDKPEAEKAGFYGIDVYSLWESLDEILRYLETQPGTDLDAARRAFECFEAHERDGQRYGISATFYGEGCQDEVVALLRKLQDKWRQTGADDREDALSAEMNALAVQGAEAYYRTMIRHDAESWNVRDRHMVKALDKLMDYHGEGTRVVVWEHNTHIGDARWTDMAADGMVNVGQLLREKYGSEVFAVGYGTYEGTVVAGRAWGSPAQVMKVPSAIRGSWEELLHRSGARDKLLIFDEQTAVLDEMWLGHRAIGVVYHPERERGNYVPTVVSKRYDAFIYFDETRALVPLSLEAAVSY
ncbi:erythromycin esterase family protein [Paenibacillus soyae]|uniref:Erythromycin esterase family protein n=1 Tax=Paenibacillus soyae TaxID=2969249 RepID=A0A9X2MLV3_9BACL|nr:erythromycin esterase family protein [Paenibacillus soyae]MCR2802725.1 erythromycin esterase family protein [Paenibacillus soyae]